MSTVKSKKLQIGTDATSSNNFTIYQPDSPDGSLRIGVGNADNPTEVARFDSNGMVGGGKVLQVLQTVKTDTWSTTSGTLTDVTGLSVSITPSSTSSKILIMTTVWASSTYYAGHLALVRNSTEIAKADTASNRPISFLDFADDATVQNSHGKIQCLTGQYLDSPSTTSATTYKIQGARRYDNGNSPTLYVNRSSPDRDTNTYDQRKVSTITVMEIAG